MIIILKKCSLLEIVRDFTHPSRYFSINYIAFVFKIDYDNLVIFMLVIIIIIRYERSIYVTEEIKIGSYSIRNL